MFSTAIPIHRNRIIYLTATGAMIALGLLSREVTGLFPIAWGKYPGDALWALMVFLWMGVFFPHASTARNGILALTFSFLIEFSQLYHAPWIDAIRRTTPGHLVLGFGFSPFDLLAYSAGVSIGVMAEYAIAGFHRFLSHIRS